MRLVFWPTGWEDYLHWRSGDANALARVNLLIRETMRDPFRGLGKPEPLKNNLKGWWSRRIDREHRLVCRVTGNGDAQALEIAQCRFHY